MRLPPPVRLVAGLLRDRPFSLLYQVTNRCNLACPFCDFWPHGDPRQELTLPEIRGFARALADVSSFLVSIEGGEPLARPDLPDIVRAFADAGHLAVLYTNGWLVDETRARALAGAGLHRVGVSIDFPDAARHDAMRRGAGAFDRAIAAVGRLGAAMGPRRVHVMTVLMKQNQEDLDALLRLSASLGVSHHLTLLSAQGFRRQPSAEASLPDAAALRRLPELVRAYPHLAGFRSYLRGVPRFLAGDALPRCRAGIQSMNLDHAGNLSPCIEKIDQATGNVRDAPLPEILSRLAALDAGSGCQRCWTLCRGTAQALGPGRSLEDWRDLARM